jgi:hypothetical protein
VIQHRKINKTKKKKQQQQSNNNMEKKKHVVMYFVSSSIYQRNGNVRGRSAPSFTNGL